MHTVHLGIGQDLCGSLLAELLLLSEEQAPGMPADKILRSLWMDFCTWCSNNKIKRPSKPFSVRLIGWGKSRQAYAILSNGVKAAQVKILISWLAKAVQEMPGQNAWRFRLRAVCAWGLAKFLHVCDNASFFFSDEECDSMSHAANCFLMCYQQLAVDSLAANKKMYKCRPKHHYFDELWRAAKSNKKNPRHHHCFMDEDYVGRISKLGKNTHRGQVALRTLQRYSLYMKSLWHKRRSNKRLRQCSTNSVRR